MKIVSPSILCAAAGCAAVALLLCSVDWFIPFDKPSNSPEVSLESKTTPAIAVSEAGSAKHDSLAAPRSAAARDWASEARALLLMQKDSPDREMQLRTHFEAWGEKDGAAAAAFASQLPDENESIICTMAALDAWVLQDQTPALAWLRAIPGSKLKYSVLNRIAYAVGARDPQKAVELAGEFPDEHAREEFVSQVTRGWATMKPEEAAQWSRELPDGTMRTRVCEAVAMEWAQRSPAAAADFIAVAFPPGESQDVAAITITTRWASLDPVGAARWVEQFPQSELRLSILRSLLSHWVYQDRSAAEGWLTKLPDGSLRDEARAFLAESGTK